MYSSGSEEAEAKSAGQSANGGSSLNGNATNSSPTGGAAVGSRPTANSTNSTAALEKVLFDNKFPQDKIADPKIVSPVALKTMSGNLNYVILEDGSLVLGKSPHTSLTNNMRVQAAGEVQLYNGKIKWLDNASGHYQPSGPQIKDIAESAFSVR